MKKSIYILLFGLILILSCKENQNKQGVSKINQNKKSITIKKNRDLKLNLKIEKIINKDSLDISFVGKKTQDLNKYNFHCCFGGLLYDKEKKYAISAYSLTVGNCRNGKSKIILEKFIDYFDNGKANFEIKDEFVVNSSYPKKCFSTVVLKINNNPESNYLIEYEDNSKEILTIIHKIWKIDLEKLKFIEIEKPKKFKCYNPDYADGI